MDVISLLLLFLVLSGMVLWALVLYVLFEKFIGEER